MPFVPLKTDEKLEAPVKRERDMDTAMLFGCGSFVVASIGVWFLTILPHLLLTDVYRLRTLATCLALGLIPSAVLGLVAVRKMGLPGACGFVAGSMASAIFLFLRLREVEVALKMPQDAPQPEYPAVFVWAIPFAWFLIAVLLATTFLKKEELPS